MKYTYIYKLQKVQIIAFGMISWMPLFNPVQWPTRKHEQSSLVQRNHTSAKVMLASDASLAHDFPSFGGFDLKISVPEQLS